MLSDVSLASEYRFKVIDALDAPHGGRLLRLELISGKPPRLTGLRGRELVATSPTGRICRLTVTDFAALGGKVRQGRFEKERRIDVRVQENDETGPVELLWEMRPANARERSHRR